MKISYISYLRMSRIFVLSILGISALLTKPAESSEWKMMQKINKYNLLARCFGDDIMTDMAIQIHKACEFCAEVQSPLFSAGMTMQGVRPYPLPAPINAAQLEALRSLLSNPTSLATLLNQGRGGGISRGKRQAVSSGLLNPSEEDKMDFMEDLADFKEGWENKLGNLSCVLTQLDMLDAAGNINMNKFSYQSMANVLKDSPAGSDPAFVKKIADGYSDCYDISRSWPQQALDRHPVMKEHGRHMIFFECSKKIQTQMCSKFQIAQWMDVLYGKHDSASNAEYGLPTDRYDAALMAVKVQAEAATDEMKFVDDFFWQKSKF